MKQESRFMFLLVSTQPLNAFFLSRYKPLYSPDTRKHAVSHWKAGSAGGIICLFY
jgi:hypothetical protein